MNQFAATLRRLMAPLKGSVFHPQWLVFREDKNLRSWLNEMCRGRVLDVGCSDGWARHAMPADCEYVGLDYPLTANALYGTRPDVFADAASLPFADGSFDTVLLLEVLEHVRDPARVLSEAQRVLKVGGKVLVGMPFLYPLHDAPHDYQRFTGPGLVHSLKQAGLSAGIPRPRVAGFRAVGLLSAIALAEAVVSATEKRRWRLAFVPALILAIPVLNIMAWLLGPLSQAEMFATGFHVVGRKD